MQFAILMTTKDAAWAALTAAEQARVLDQHREYTAALQAEGRFVTSWGMFPASEGRTVNRDASGSLTVREGPSTAADPVGGVYIIEAASMDEAVEWAKRGRFIPGDNEVRQLQ